MLGVLNRSIRQLIWGRGILSESSSAYTDLMDLGYIVASGYEYDLTIRFMAGVRLIGAEELFILDALAEKKIGKKAALFNWVGAQYQQTVMPPRTSFLMPAQVNSLSHQFRKAYCLTSEIELGTTWFSGDPHIEIGRA